MLYIVALVIQIAFVPDSEFLFSLRRELNSIYSGTPVAFTLHPDSSRVSLGKPHAVIYVKLRGNCRPTLAAVRGALASTRSDDGIIQPLIDIDCNKLATFVTGNDVPRAGTSPRA